MQARNVCARRAVRRLACGHGHGRGRAGVCDERAWRVSCMWGGMCGVRGGLWVWVPVCAGWRCGHAPFRSYRYRAGLAASGVGARLVAVCCCVLVAPESGVIRLLRSCNACLERGPADCLVPHLAMALAHPTPCPGGLAPPFAFRGYKKKIIINPFEDVNTKAHKAPSPTAHRWATGGLQPARSPPQPRNPELGSDLRQRR